MTLTAIKCQRPSCGGMMELQEHGEEIERISELVCSLCDRTPEHAFDQIVELVVEEASRLSRELCAFV